MHLSFLFCNSPTSKYPDTFSQQITYYSTHAVKQTDRYWSNNWKNNTRDWFGLSRVSVDWYDKKLLLLSEMRFQNNNMRNSALLFKIIKVFCNVNQCTVYAYFATQSQWIIIKTKINTSHRQWRYLTICSSVWYSYDYILIWITRIWYQIIAHILFIIYWYLIMWKAHVS